MENDDDIDILSGQDTIDGSIIDPHNRLLAQEFVISRSPGSRPDPAVHALQQAYADLKKRFNETVEKNQLMSRRLRDVGRLKTTEPDMATYGDHTDSFNSQGAAATAEQPSAENDNMRAQQGYIRYLERERMNDQARVQQLSSLKASYEESCRTMQTKLKETVSDLKRTEDDLMQAKETIRELKEENMQLRDDRDSFRKHAAELQDFRQNSLQQSSSLQSRELEEVKVKCQQLEKLCGDLRTECDRLTVSEGIAQSDLQTANKQIQDLTQELTSMTEKCHVLEEERDVGRDVDLLSESPLPTVQELAHLKRVIADLKKTVVLQRDFLSKLGKTNSIVPARTEAVLDVSTRPTVEDVGQSWENIPVEATWCRGGGGTAIYRDGPRSPAPSRRLAIDTSVVPGNTRTSNSSPRRANSDTHALRLAQEHSRSEVLVRRSSDTSQHSPRSKSEVLARTSEQRHQQTFNNLGHTNGGTVQYQAGYENSGSRRITPQAVVSDVFGVVDNTPAFPVNLELRQNSDRRPSPQQNGQAEQAEKVCPVCSRDFSAMPIDDFQTHVFECFDDQENAPETLRAGETTERICPMCNALFPEAVPQEEFEKHVQGHFEQEIVDRFEILNP